MERIVYRKTLDVHKSGVQFTLQGFETADNMSRRIELSLMASGDTIDFPLEQIKAVMYVTTPNASEPSINECIIKDNTIIYDVLPIVEEGITEMQIKLIDTRPDGANGVLAAPKFAVEVSKSNTDDESVKQTTTYTALEESIAKAKGVYDSRFLRMEIESDCTFKVYYADGTMYETDVLAETLLKGEAIMSQSYARGGTGIREGEDTDNSMYYSNVSRSASKEADRVRGEATDLLEEVTKHGVYTAFSINFETGEVEYISPVYTFNVNEETGNLEAFGETYIPEDSAEYLINEYIKAKNDEIINRDAVIETEIADLKTSISTEEIARQNADTIEKEERQTADITEKEERQAADAIEKEERVAADLIEKEERQAEISVERERIDQNKDDIDVLKGRAKTHEDSIETLEHMAQTNANDIASNKEDIENLQYYIPSNILDWTRQEVGKTAGGKTVYRARKMKSLSPNDCTPSENVILWAFNNFDVGDNVTIHSFNAFMLSPDMKRVFPLPYYSLDGELQSYVYDYTDGVVNFFNKADWRGYRLVVEVIYS